MNSRFYPRPLLLIIGFFLMMALLIGLRAEEPTRRGRAQVIDIAMSTAEQGGFAPAHLRLQAGQKATLLFHAMDVAHALAIGPGLGVDLGVIAPGVTKEITLTIERPGLYTFYCNLWCSPQHWRMRGVIEVVAADGSLPPANSDPVIAALTAAGIDIDAAHTGEHGSDTGLLLAVSAPITRPLPNLDIPPALQTLDWQRTHSLLDALTEVSRAHPASGESELAAATVVWRRASSASNPQLTKAADLYTKNCAACHGETGQGDGMAAFLAPTPPAPFSVASLLEKRPDVLYAKIRRGGMGTGMPNFGAIFTPDETWALVDYLWLLALAESPDGP